MRKIRLSFRKVRTKFSHFAKNESQNLRSLEDSDKFQN